MAKPTKSSSSSSTGDVESITLAYTESIPNCSFCKSPESSASSLSLSSNSSETLYTQESYTSLFASLEHMKEKEAFFGYEPVWRSMSMTEGPKIHALDYFWEHSTFQLFSFLMSHLLAHTPDDPVPFLVSLVDRCIRYRDEGEDPPLLFEDSHVNSVYTALDPMDDGTIQYPQYLTAMNTLGLMEFNIIPEDLEPKNRNVPKNVFIREAKQALLTQLDRLIGKDRLEGSFKESGVEGSGSKGAPREHVSSKNSREVIENVDCPVVIEDKISLINKTNKENTSIMSSSKEGPWEPSKISFKMTSQTSSEVKEDRGNTLRMIQDKKK